jgi:hypothetical protein
MIRLFLAYKRAEDDKLMKFQRATEFTRVPHDLTTLLYTIHGPPSVSIALLRSNRK